MKKQYIKPCVEQTTVIIDCPMLAGSTDFKASEVTLSTESADNSAAYSRGYNVWGDEEEEEW